MARAAIDCAVCGSTIPQPKGPQKYCPDCALARQKRQALVNAQKRRTEAKERVARLCMLCGKVIETPKGAQKTCESCRRQITSRPEQERGRRRVSPPAPSGNWNLRGKDLTRVGVEANALGLTYGKYVSFIETGFIDRYCQQEGIEDGSAFVQKAWETFLREKKEREKAMKAREKVGGWKGRPW